MSGAGSHMVLVSAASCPAQPWRNGGGLTRTLLAWPAEDDWRLRISRADVAADGPFSAYPGVTRWFTVLRGTGVALTIDGVRRELRPDSEALCFDGAAAPECELLDGATQDLNLMARGGTACMTRVLAGQPWPARWQLPALYTDVAGRWSDGHDERLLPAATLLWQAHGSSFGFACGASLPGAARRCAHWTTLRAAHCGTERLGSGPAALTADTGARWRFTPAAGSNGSAWWLGFTP